MKNVKNEKSKKLFYAVNGIGDDLVNEAESYDLRRERARRIRRFSAVAASFVLIVAIALTVILIQKGNGNNAVYHEPTPIVIETAGVSSAGSRAALPNELKGVNVRAESADGRLISSAENFIIETEEPCDVDVVANNMTLSPKTNYSLTKVSETEFKVSPTSGTLFPGTVYNFAFGDPENPAASYSFQTESEFLIKHILPADMETEVGVDTGIEITFSEAIEKCDYSAIVMIEPEVRCEYELYPDEKTLAVIPKSSLEYGTIYKVTVTSGAVSKSGKKLAADVSASFMTEKSEKYAGEELVVNIRNGVDYGNRQYIYNYTDEFIYAPGDDVSITYAMMRYYNYTGIKAGSAKLYRYGSVDDAAKAIKEYEASLAHDGDVYTTDGLSFVGEFKPTEEELKGYYSFGSNLERGAYLAVLRFMAKNGYGEVLSCVKYVVIQVSDLRAFTLSSDGKTLMKVDNVAGKTVEGATVLSESFSETSLWENSANAVQFDKYETKVKNGVCVIETGDDDCSVVTVRQGDDAVVLCVRCSALDDSDYGMNYIYTDREVYFSDDTVNFSGFAVPIIGENPSALYLTTSGSSTLQELAVGENGEFSGSFAIENHSEGGEYIKIIDADENVYASKYIRVTEKEKPQITASISFDKLFYRYGETVTATLKATFFDGTPAEGFDFTIYSHPFVSGGDYSATTDENGEIEYVITTGRLSASSTYPSTIYVYAELTGYETQTLTVENSVYYFHSDYVFETVWERNRRALTLNHLDTSSLLTEDDFRYGVFPENTKGEPAEGSVSYSLVKHVITKTEKREYDMFTKRSYTYYEYRTHEYTVEKGMMEFNNGVIELPLYEAEDFAGGCYYDICYNDGRNTYEVTVWATKNKSESYNGNAIGSKITLDKKKYAVGDDFTATFEMNGEQRENVLFAVFANGLEEYGVGDSFTGKFDGYKAVGGRVFAVVFDTEAKHYSCSSERLMIDTSGSELEVTVEADKEVYAPGDKATVRIKADGAPGATLILSVVDEACFALGEQNENTLDKYFGSASMIGKGGYYGFYDYYYWDLDYYFYGYGTGNLKDVTVNGRFSSIFSSYGNETEGYYSEKDTEDKGAIATEPANAPSDEDRDISENSVRVRSYFADNPVFVTTELDENGEALIVFTVPDNITSWRLTCAAADFSDGSFESVRLGNAVSDIICTKDFFINLSAPSYYIVGDDAALLARSFGTASEEEVRYTATLRDDAGKIVAETEARDDSKGYAELNFGKVEAGHYVATVYGYGETSSDALESDFNVIESAEMMYERRTVNAEELKSITPALYPVTLSFHNENASHSILNSVIGGLSYGSSVERADVLAASYAALKSAKQIYGSDVDDEIESIKERFKEYVSYEGLISLLTYSEGDVELTAEILASCPELLDSDEKSNLVDYLEALTLKNVQFDEVTLCASLSALASLDEPVLDVLYNVAGVAGDYPVDAKLYLASAFASIGDWVGAKAIYDQIKANVGVENKEYSTLKFEGDTFDETIRLSSIALLTASRCNKTDAEQIAKYLTENRSKTEVPIAALASFTRYFLPENESAGGKLVYSVMGEEREAEVDGWNTVTVKLTKSEFESFEIVSFDFGLVIDVSYYAPASEVLEEYELTDRVKVKKTIEPYMNGMYKVTLAVSGTSTRVSESFDLTDIVPSGARYLSSYDDTYSSSGWDDSQIHTGAYVYNSAGQKVRGSVWIYNRIYDGQNTMRTDCPEYSFSVEVSYVIRGAVKGEFVAEPAVIRNLATDVYSTSERYTVTITDGGWAIKTRD